MSVATDRLPVWSLIAPWVALVVGLALKDGASMIVGILLAVALLAAVKASVHHAEVVALRVGIRSARSSSRWR
jgi:hypothetical protein